MVSTPLRQRRTTLVSSTPVETPEGTAYHVRMQPKRDEVKFRAFGKHFDFSEKQEDGQQPKIGWFEKAVQRDFSIGVSLAYLTVAAASTLTGGLPALATAGVIGAGMLGGAASDYMRNSKELEEGTTITPPTRFNRDAVKAALGWGALTRLGVTVATALSGGALAVPAALTWGAVGVALAYGAARGSEKGYQRMENEYKAAEFKHEHPEYGVTLGRGRGQEREKQLASHGAGVATEIGQTVVAGRTSPAMEQMPAAEQAPPQQMPEGGWQAFVAGQRGQQGMAREAAGSHSAAILAERAAAGQQHQRS